MATCARAKRLLYLVHRWTGVGACILMALWLLSGMVMLFVGYPRFSSEERLGSLPPLGPSAVRVPVEAALGLSRSAAAVRRITLTSIADQPRYVLQEEQGDFLVVDALTGRRAPTVDSAAALDSARSFIRGKAALYAGQSGDDRWTHSARLDPHRPLFKVQMADADATLLYVSSSTGEVVMDAPRAQRYWNVVGAWLHWLYLLRDGSKDPVWSWLVIALSAVGTVSAVAGALAGVWRWRFAGRYRTGTRTPYREFQMRWHHITGLLFGTVLITWVFSGLMSMNPLGIFDPQGERPNRAAYHQGAPGMRRPGIGANDALALLRGAGFDASEIEWRVLGGTPYLLAHNSSGATRLVMADAQSFVVRERWPDPALRAAGARLMQSAIKSAQTLHDYDNFYYKRGAASMYGASERRLPVLRLDFGDSGATSVYIDPHTGDVALSVDRAQRAGRWLFQLLHSWDAPVLLRFAAAREALLVLLSLGSLAIAVTGTVIGYRRLKSFLFQKIHGRRRTARPNPPTKE